jgi:hypothetical protein
MTADATIDYDGLQQEALRGLVRTVLLTVAKTGLPGEHHLYISFDVKAPGVILSKRLREKYPHEMTIVLQHRFWDLSVGDERFEVKLTFDGIPERLVVPFNAIKVFLDPSVRFVVHFEGHAPDTEDDPIEADSNDTRPARVPAVRKPRAARPKPRTEKDANGASHLNAVPVEAPQSLQKPIPVQGLPKPASLPNAKPQPVARTATPTDEGVTVTADTEKPASGAQVVSLDAFRKK